MSKLMLVAAVATLAISARADAQLGFGVSAGPSNPRGDFGTVASSGYQVSALANLSVPLAPIGARFEGSFGEYDYKNTAIKGSARLISGTANIVLSTPGLLGPYLIGGVGYYHATSECTACSTSSSNVGYNGGAGLKIGLAGLSVFAEARYHYVPGESAPTNGGVKGGSTQFVPLSVGITF